jgi:hypothetical protein
LGKEDDPRPQRLAKQVDNYLKKPLLFSRTTEWNYGRQQVDLATVKPFDT